MDQQIAIVPAQIRDRDMRIPVPEVIERRELIREHKSDEATEMRLRRLRDESHVEQLK